MPGMVARDIRQPIFFANPMTMADSLRDYVESVDSSTKVRASFEAINGPVGPCNLGEFSRLMIGNSADLHLNRIPWLNVGIEPWCGAF